MNVKYLYGKLMKKLHGTCVLHSRIDRTAVVGESCNIVDSVMGRYSYCCSDCQIVDAVIGGFCSISDHVYVGGFEHPSDRISTSPVFMDVRHSGPSKRFARFAAPVSKRTVIGNDVWIGHGVTVKKGVSIGDGAVIGSNAMVTKDVPPYAVVVGNPARIVSYRFPEEIIARLEEIQWWNLPDEKIAEAAELFRISHPTLEDINLYFPEKQ